MASWVTTPCPLKGVLLDISGVLRDGNKAIPGSVEAFQRLLASDLLVRLVTNESQVTREGSVEKLEELGYKGVKAPHIYAPANSLIPFLKEKGYRPHLLVHPNIQGEFSDLLPPGVTDPPNCVVIGDAAENFTYENMNLAFRSLLSMRTLGLPPKLFTLGRGRYYKEEGGLVLDVGPFCAALEYALDIKAELFGKPSPSFFQTAIQDMGLTPDQVVMIGDDIVGDVGGAQGAGCRGVLVRTGKYRPEDETNKEVTPNGVVDNLKAAVDLLLGPK